MGFAFQWFGLAEGALFDQRGGLTVVGFNPNTWQVSELPATINLTNIAVLEADLSEDSSLRGLTEVPVSVSPTIEDDAGVVIAAGQIRQTLRLAATVDEPNVASLNLVIGHQLQVATAGLYTATLRVQVADGPEEVRSRRFRVSLNAPGAATLD